MFIHDWFIQMFNVFSFLQVYNEIEPDLIRFGQAVATDISDLGETLDDSPPKLRQYNAWGERVDEIIMHPAWRQLHDVSAREGLISIPYTKKFGEWR